MSDGIFRRNEQKYILTDAQRCALEQLLTSYMQPDPYGQSTICSLYFDTPDYRLIRRSLEKPAYKEKLRLRSYGPAVPGRPVFLELKKKYQGIVYKRRITLTPDEAKRCIRAHHAPTGSQIGREIDYALCYYPQLEPRVYLCYDRIAYLGKEDPALRMTFDRNIRFRTEDLDLASAPSGQQLLAPGENLLEVKALGAMPLWLVHFLSENRIRQASFSKYGRAYTLILQKNHESRGIPCA